MKTVNSSRPGSNRSLRGAKRARMSALTLAAFVGSSLAGCGGGGGTGVIGESGTVDTVQPQLLRVEYGRLADVYGLQTTEQGTIRTLFRKDVLIGSNINDERPSTSTLSDNEIRFDFFGSDPDTLQPRLFIPREIGSPSFNELFGLLDDELREVTAMTYGNQQVGQPFTVVPRNAGLRLLFSAPLGINDSFFVTRNGEGQVTALNNTEAVQLLSIVGDPAAGEFVPMPARVIVKEREIVLDPVLLGTEGLQYQSTNNAAGLPASPDQVGANIRIAVALEGPLAIPGLRESESQGLTGLNNSLRTSIVRDFRSGNSQDDSSDIARGFIRDTLPLRVIGEIPFYLERVDEINAFTQEITLFKNGISHEVDLGDVIRIVADSSGVVQGSGEVVVDPADDRGAPGVQHVRVRIRRIEGLADLDPRNLPGYPTQIQDREPWLVQNAPRAVCVAEYRAGAGLPTGDDPRNFLTFTPTPLILNGVRPQPNEFVSPFAGAVVRFTKPVDMETVKWADTFFFAMRDLATDDAIEDFIASRPNNLGGVGMDPATFNLAKYRTPYMITARVFDEDGSQTSLRLQPSKGFFLDDTMRNPPSGADYRYFLHLISDSVDGGIRDLAGNRLDLQGGTADAANAVVIPFTVDTRMDGPLPVFPDNLAISIVRRFASQDEDANPSYFLGDEVRAPNSPSIARAYPLEDLFGAFLYLDNKLVARPTTRTRVVADNLNQLPIVQQPPTTLPQDPLGWCPQTASDSFDTELQRGSNSANNLVQAGIQNPMNPYGCRLQTLWREVDLSLSRTNPFDFNLDIEQMYWAPFTGTNLSFDEFDQVSLWLSHSEYRPIPCVGDFSALPSLPESGLKRQFERNFAWNPVPAGSGSEIETQAPRVAAYVNRPLTIDPTDVVYEPNGVNRFLPLPEFQQPYFVYRDETVIEQGGQSDPGGGSDISAGVVGGVGHWPYIVSPFNMGLGRRRVDRTGDPGDLQFVNTYWNDGRSRSLVSPGSADNFTGGLVGNIALPLLADFWTYCDTSDHPVGGGYIALGTNGWQTAVTVQSDPRPFFRVYSAGRAVPTVICRAPGEPEWNFAEGGYTPPPTVQTTDPGDNTFYWIMMDVLRRQTVITNGFIDIYNPHRVPEGFADPRLGPFYLAGGEPQLPGGVLPTFDYEFDPPLADLPSGTSIVPQFRGASIVDPTPFYWNAWAAGNTSLYPDANFTASARQQMRPTADNFALDPFKAGDAHMRKWDTRGGRNEWTYLYNRTVTSYVEDPNVLMDPTFTTQFASAFNPENVRYVNWRFIAGNNADATPPISPTIETFSLTYRFE